MELHHLQSIRIPDYDYTRPASYYVTICAHQRIPFFGNIIDGEMHLNDLGKIAHSEWHLLTKRFPTIELGTFIVMPNHIHFIVILHDTVVGAGLAPALGHPHISHRCAKIRQGVPLPKQPKLGDIVGAYKSLVAMKILDIYKSRGQQMGQIWQRNYYERIIRSNDAWTRIDAYIESNPANWAKDDLFGG